MSCNSYLLRSQVLHSPGDAVPEDREISGREGCGVLAEVIEVLPGAVVAQVRQELAVHHVLENQVMGLCNHQREIQFHPRVVRSPPYLLICERRDRAALRHRYGASPPRIELMPAEHRHYGIAYL